MHNVTTSRHIRSASEIFLLAPIKPGFVPISELVLSYASRVSAVLSALFEIRQLKTESGLGDPVGPIERLQTIHRVQWTVLEPHDERLRDGLRPDTAQQIRTPQLVLTSHFDSSWEDYFTRLVDIGGPLLDLIFSHCHGYEGHSCQADGYEAFSDWIRRHQRPANFMFAASPELSVEDLRYSGTLLQTDPAKAGELARLSVPRPELEALAALGSGQKKHDPRTRAAVRAVHALHEINTQLFSDAIELDQRSGRTLFENAVRSVLQYEPDLARLSLVLNEQAKATPPLIVPAPIQWVQNLMQPPAAAPPSAEPIDQAALLASVQGNVLAGYPAITQGAVLLLACDNPSAFIALLDKMKDRVTTEGVNQDAQQPDALKARPFVNFSITYDGLKRSGLNADVLAEFPREFQEGMEERAGILGDVDRNHPQFWLRPVSKAQPEERLQLSSVDAVVQIQTTAPFSVEDKIRAWEFEKLGIQVVHVLPLTRTQLANGEVSSFNFVDFVSQPVPKGVDLLGLPKHASARDQTALGEFVLGYADRNRVTARCAREGALARSLFHGGTYLAMRKMKLDAGAFEAYIEKTRQAIDDFVTKVGRGKKLTADEVKTLIVGRTPTGAVRAPIDKAQGSPSNDFSFSDTGEVNDDPRGDACPFHSHIRRTNPRTSSATPRIVRRGLSYGPSGQGEDEGEVGSFFMAYNANLAEQYEVIQRWVNGGNSTGIASTQNDLLCGSPNVRGVPRWVCLDATVPPDERVYFPMPSPDGDPFVTLRWGMYSFVPSREGIAWLAQTLRTPARSASGSGDPEAIARGRARLAELDALPRSLAESEWKRILEEVAEAGSSRALQNADVWAAIRAAGGVYAVSPAFVVVGSESGARAVLGDDGGTFSVCEYRTRMQSTVGDHYLALDVAPRQPESGPSYAELSAKPNAWLAGLSDKAFDDAFQTTRSFLNDPGSFDQEVDHVAPDGRAVNAVSIRDLAHVVVAKLCHAWLEMPGRDGKTDDVSLAASLERFLLTSRYTFQARPEKQLEIEARRAGSTIPKDYKQLNGAFATALRSSTYPQPTAATPDDGAIRQAVLGAVIGFAPPTVGAIIRVLDQWIETQDFWRVRRIASDRLRLRAAVLDALSQTPSPTILYRTAAKPTRLGEVDVPAQAMVVLGLGSICEDAKRQGSALPEAWLFGGQHGGAGRAGGDPPHGCPALDAGVDVILGIASALFGRQNLKRERRLVLSYDR